MMMMMVINNKLIKLLRKALAKLLKMRAESTRKGAKELVAKANVASAQAIRAEEAMVKQLVVAKAERTRYANELLTMLHNQQLCEDDALSTIYDANLVTTVGERYGF